MALRSKLFSSLNLRGCHLNPSAAFGAIGLSGVRSLRKRPFTLLASLFFMLAAYLTAPGFTYASLPGKVETSPHSFTLNKKIKKGSLLIATMGMSDPNFAGTVILMMEYGLRGAVGLIINRPYEVDAAKALPEVKGAPSTLYYGGPVEPNRLWILIRANKPPVGARHLFEDIYETSNVDLLQRLIDDKVPTETFHVYTGYAGWAPMQLDMELKSGGWRVLDADVEAVFTKSAKKVWFELIHPKSALPLPDASKEAEPSSSTPVRP